MGKKLPITHYQYNQNYPSKSACSNSCGSPVCLNAKRHKGIEVCLENKQKRINALLYKLVVAFLGNIKFIMSKKSHIRYTIKQTV